MSNVNETLKERGAVYGDYKGGSEFRADVMQLITHRYAEINGKLLDALHMVYVYDIVNKLSRLAATPDHIDTWHDIAGYATLVEEALKREQEPKAEQPQAEQVDDDEAAVKEFIDLMAALTGRDSEITKMAQEAYDEYKKDKENGQSKN